MIRNRQAGQVLVSTALGLVMLAGLTGFAVDMGYLRYQKRLQQTAADSAAIAAAQNLSLAFSGNGNYTAAAQNASTQNAFTDNNSGAGCTGGAIGCISVAVNNGPLLGPHLGDKNYVEVVITDVQPTFFMKIFGVTSKPVLARAVATNVSGGTNSSCLYTLGPPTNAIVGIDAAGNAKIVAPKCGISDNGNLDTTGNSYTIQAKTMSVSGNCIGSHCGSPDVQCMAYPNGTCPAIGHAPASQDPFSTLSPPTQPAYSTSCPAVPPAGFCDFVSAANSNVTLQPGTYNSIDIGSNSTVTMAPGIYYINGPLAGDKGKNTAGLNFEGGGTLTDMANPGVMIYFTNGSSLNKVVGGANLPDIELKPMTVAENATYAGILFYQDPADTTPAYFGGDNKSTYDGTVYMPTTTVNVYGNGTETFNGTVVAYSVATQGSPIVTFGQSPGGVPIPALLTQPVLVE